MFDYKRKNLKTPIQGQTSVIASGVAITGDLSGQESILLNGQFNGSLQSKSVTIGVEGRMEGNITANQAAVHGVFSGEAHVHTLTLHKTAVITGKIHYRILNVEAGARVEGHFIYEKKQGQDKQTKAQFLKGVGGDKISEKPTPKTSTSEPKPVAQSSVPVSQKIAKAG